MEEDLKLYLTIVLFMLLSWSNATLKSDTVTDPYLEQTRKNLVIETKNFYTNRGVKRKETELRKIMTASYITATIFKNYPALSIQERMAKFSCYSAQEQGSRLNCVEFNIPGTTMGNSGRTIKRFSLDFGHSGLNDMNVKWTYAIASVLQNYDGESKRRLLRKLKIKYNINDRLIRELQDIKIPKDIKLKRIDYSLHRIARLQYNYLKSNGVSPNKMRKILKVNYSENTQDEVTSLMIYRVLVELDRYSRGWSVDVYEKDLYSYLCQFID